MDTHIVIIVVVNFYSYGDRRPVTFPGKLFAILWIIVGYVIITLLTSYMVSSITLVLVKERTTIYGAKVSITNDDENQRF